MSELSGLTIHELRNQIRTLDENIFRLYTVEREFDTFARPILNWFINRPEIISAVDATDILTTSFIKKYGGTSAFWHEYVAVSNAEMRSEVPENRQMAAPAATADLDQPAAAPVSTPRSAPSEQAPHAAPHPAKQLAAQPTVAEPVISEPSSAEPENAAPENSAPITESRSVPQGQNPTSPLQGAGPARQRVRARQPNTAPSAVAHVTPDAPINAEITPVDVAEQHQAEAALPAEPPAKPTPEPKAKTAHSTSVAAKPKKAAESGEDKPQAAFVPEPERELLFDEIRITLDGMMRKYKLTQFKELAEKITEAAKPHENLSVPLSILYALHSNKYFRKYNRTYVTSQATALNILRLLRHMKNPKSGHLRQSDEEIMAEFRTSGNIPVLPDRAAQLTSSN